jgi:hypothetical protein
MPRGIPLRSARVTYFPLTAHRSPLTVKSFPRSYFHTHPAVAFGNGSGVYLGVSGSASRAHDFP